jgi:hypothetical protein
MEVSGQLHASVALPPAIQTLGTYWMEGWVGPRADLDVMEKKKSLTLQGMEPRLLGPSTRSLVAIQTEQLVASPS